MASDESDTVLARFGVYRARCRREARAVARLSHPAIVQIFDILEVDGTDCIVMEYIEGESLAELVARGPLEIPVALRQSPSCGPACRRRSSAWSGACWRRNRPSVRGASSWWPMSSRG